jgi:hypothetical protein
MNNNSKIQYIEPTNNGYIVRYVPPGFVLINTVTGKYFSAGQKAGYKGIRVGPGSDWVLVLDEKSPDLQQGKKIVTGNNINVTNTFNQIKNQLKRKNVSLSEITTIPGDFEIALKNTGINDFTYQKVIEKHEEFLYELENLLDFLKSNIASAHNTPVFVQISELIEALENFNFKDVHDLANKYGRRTRRILGSLRSFIVQKPLSPSTPLVVPGSIVDDEDEVSAGKDLEDILDGFSSKLHSYLFFYRLRRLATKSMLYADFVGKVGEVVQPARVPDREVRKTLVEDLLKIHEAKESIITREDTNAKWFLVNSFSSPLEDLFVLDSIPEILIKELEDRGILLDNEEMEIKLDSSDEPRFSVQLKKSNIRVSVYIEGLKIKPSQYVQPFFGKHEESYKFSSSPSILPLYPAEKEFTFNFTIDSSKGTDRFSSSYRVRAFDYSGMSSAKVPVFYSIRKVGTSRDDLNDQKNRFRSLLRRFKKDFYERVKSSIGNYLKNLIFSTPTASNFYYYLISRYSILEVLEYTKSTTGSNVSDETFEKEFLKNIFKTAYGRTLSMDQNQRQKFSSMYSYEEGEFPKITVPGFVSASLHYVNYLFNKFSGANTEFYFTFEDANDDVFLNTPLHNLLDKDFMISFSTFASSTFKRVLEAIFKSSNANTPIKEDDIKDIFDEFIKENHQRINLDKKKFLAELVKFINLEVQNLGGVQTRATQAEFLEKLFGNLMKMYLGYSFFGTKSAKYERPDKYVIYSSEGKSVYLSLDAKSSGFGDIRMFLHDKTTNSVVPIFIELKHTLNPKVQNLFSLIEAFRDLLNFKNTLGLKGVIKVHLPEIFTVNSVKPGANTPNPKDVFVVFNTQIDNAQNSDFETVQIHEKYNVIRYDTAVLSNFTLYGPSLMVPERRLPLKGGENK